MLKKIDAKVKSKIFKKIFEYNDYRDVIRYFLNVFKVRDKSLSLSKISKHCGFSSHTYLVLVLNGKRNLKDDAVKKIISYFGLEGRYKTYFKLLVDYCHEKDLEKKSDLYDKILNLKVRYNFYSPEQYQYKYFQKWYYPIIRSLAVHSNWDGDFKKLSNMCFPKITARQAQTAVNDLVEMGLLNKVSDKKYELIEANIDDFDVPLFVKKIARRDVLENNIKALEILPADKRYSVYSIWSMSDETYNKVIEEFEKFRKKVNKLVDKDKKVDSVFNMLFQVFPQSKKID